MGRQPCLYVCYGEHDLHQAMVVEGATTLKEVCVIDSGR
jgi:hypothetical protein